MKNVLLVFGGVSYEHDISVITAFQIFKKSKLCDYKLVLFYVSRDGKFYICNENKVKLSDFSKKNFDGKNKSFKEVVFVSGENQKLFLKTRFGLKEYLNAGVAVFACHGGHGENGKLVTLFESVGIACSAGDSKALSICMDKMLFKMFARSIKIPVVAGFKLSRNDFINAKDVWGRKLSILRYPVVIKVNSGGSSIGLFVARSEEEFNEKILEAFEFDDEIIVERFIEKTREFNIAILGDSKKYEISEIDEPIKTNDILSFSDKYLSGGKNDSCFKNSKGSMEFSDRKIPDDLSESLIQKMKKFSEKIFLKLGLIGVVRLDFLYDEKFEKIYICEVNAIPGSLAFYFFKKNRIVVNDLVEKLIKIAESNYKKENIHQELTVDLLMKK